MCSRSRNCQFSVRLAQAEYELVEKIFALSKKRTRREFLLSCVHSVPITVVEGLPDVMTELKRQGVNLNQIARAMNGGYVAADVRRTLAGCNAAYQQLLTTMKAGVGRADIQD